jgi:hypothetical protein
MEKKNKDISHLLPHNTNNIAILNDALKPNDVITIEGKNYLKVKVWVHELDRITGQNNEDWAQINDDFLKDERIAIMQAKIKKLESINNGLQQYNKTQEYEFVSQIKSLQKTIKNRHQQNDGSDVKLKKVTDEYNIQLRSWKKRMQKINKKNENLLTKLDKSIYVNQTLQNNIRNITDQKAKLQNIIDAQNVKIHKYLNDLMDLNDKNNLLSQQNESLSTELTIERTNAEIGEKTLKESFKNFYNNILNQKIQEMKLARTEYETSLKNEYLDIIKDKEEHIKKLQDLLKIDKIN